MGVRWKAEQAQREAQHAVEDLEQELEALKKAPIQAEEPAKPSAKAEPASKESAEERQAAAELARKQEIEDLTTRLTAAQEELRTAETAFQRADREQAAAEQAVQTADQKADAARKDAAAAKQALTSAKSAYEQGTKQLSRLQNSRTNLELRKDKTEQAQKDCASQYDACRESNAAVQKRSDEDVPAIDSGYQTVKKQAQQVCLGERQVRETCQYMDAARRLLEEIQPML